MSKKQLNPARQRAREKTAIRKHRFIEEQKRQGRRRKDIWLSDEEATELTEWLKETRKETNDEVGK